MESDKENLISHVMGKTLADNDAAQRLPACVADGMRQPPLSIANEIAKSDRILGLAEHGRRFTLQDINTFIFMMMEVVFSSLAVRLHRDDVEAKPRQACHVAKALVHPPGIGVQEMRLFRSLHRRNLIGLEHILELTRFCGHL